MTTYQMSSSDAIQPNCRARHGTHDTFRSCIGWHVLAAQSCLPSATDDPICNLLLKRECTATKQRSQTKTNKIVSRVEL